MVPMVVSEQPWLGRALAVAWVCPATLSSLTSQPSAVSPLTSLVLAPQVSDEPEQTPAAQLVPHTTPQPPQFAGSLCVLTQRPPQVVSPPVQAQPPPTQTMPVAQARPQPPQLDVSLCTSTQRPLQLTAAPVQPQVPAAHTKPDAQPVRHAPQLLLSARVSTSQPSAVLLLQSAKPASQTMEQAPAPLQRPSACGAAGQAVIVWVVPSALQVRRSAPAPHSTAPGVQARAWQRPPMQPIPAGQTMSTNPVRGSQVRTRPSLVQVLGPAAQRGARQTDPAAQT
jgi:hypothetical protein